MAAAGAAVDHHSASMGSLKSWPKAAQDSAERGGLAGLMPFMANTYSRDGTTGCSHRSAEDVRIFRTAATEQSHSAANILIMGPCRSFTALALLNASIAGTQGTSDFAGRDLLVAMGGHGRATKPAPSLVSVRSAQSGSDVGGCGRLWRCGQDATVAPSTTPIFGTPACWKSNRRVGLGADPCILTCEHAFACTAFRVIY
jgi:hypothetical protein